MSLRPWLTAIGAAAFAVYAAQTQAPANEALRFEVASLKPSNPDAQGGGIIRPTQGNQGYIATNMPLRTYLMIAYVVRDTQISGAPAWFANDRYDLNAKAEKPSTVEELHIMLQNLLADRCGLKLHKETREATGYALVIDKGTPKLTEHDAADQDYPPIRPTGPGKARATNAQMSLFALFIARGLDVPIVDKTGLTGRYDFDFEVALERVAGPDGQERAVPPDAGMISEALKKQLGLRLEKIRTTTEHIVIDRVEKPTAN